MKKIICIIIILILLISLENDKMIRFRLIANSNSNYDQEMKQIVKNEIYDELKYISDSTNIGETRVKIKESIVPISNKIGNIFERYDYNYNYDVNYGNNYFPEKINDNKVYKEGIYESLVITLGDGKGDNWWCILFPPICYSEATSNETKKVEYNFFLFDIIKKLFK